MLTITFYNFNSLFVHKYSVLSSHTDPQKNKGCCTASRNSTTQNDATAKIASSVELRFSRDDLVLIDQGTFLMGTNDKKGFPGDAEGPVRETNISPFYISKYAVSNQLFAEFVDQTGYKTEAERFGWSYVFHSFIHTENKEELSSPKGTPWWKAVDGAYWKHPEGAESDISDRMNHPVVHISWNDAIAYCLWAGVRLPTEAEWEMAARGGLEQKKFVWGDELHPEGNHQCNIWQGEFPDTNTKADGFEGTCPINVFPANGFGLYNMAGNVWEWCNDWFSDMYPMLRIKDNPKGPKQGDAKVIRGGSYLCHDSYCNRYRVAARTANTPDSSTGNLGFRIAVDTSLVEKS